jgi:prepilin-type N-terminal cleavage/methylation domain-containing protein
MLTAGILTKSNNGFTLMELTVVIIIISILLLFSFPVLRDIRLFSDPAGQTGDIIRLIHDLKKRAVEKDLDFFMHLDTGSGLVWVTDETMDNEKKRTAKQNSKRLSSRITVQDVEYPGGVETSSREYEISFKKYGYSDFALIHITENRKNLTLKIEPFLSQVQFFDTHIHFENCL